MQVEIRTSPDFTRDSCSAGTVGDYHENYRELDYAE